MPDNHAPYIADDTMRHYDELSQLGKRYHEGDKAVGAVTEYGNKAWGAGNASAHGDYAHSMSMGGVGGGIAGLLHEALRRKTEQEKNQTMGRKFMRYAGKGGLGALAGAGAGSLYTAAMHKAAFGPSKNPAPYSADMHKLLQAWQASGGGQSAAPMSANSQVPMRPLSPELIQALQAHLKMPKNIVPDELDAADAMIDLDSQKPQKAAAMKQADDSRLSFRTGTPGSLSFTGKKTPLPPKKEEKKEEAKSAGLRDFGAKAAGFNIGDLAKNIPAGLQKVMPAAGAGALGGAALGGLHGLIAPGHEDIYDDEGNVVGRQQRSRFGAALRGALGGGAAGGLAGAGMSALFPTQTAQASNWLKGQYTKGREAIDPRFARQNAVNRVNAGNPAATAEANVAAGEEYTGGATPPPSAAEARLTQQMQQESANAEAQKQLGIR
jgi:hypothetical protein